MKNLENFGVKELSLQESIEVNGGGKVLLGVIGFGIGSAVFGAGVAVGYYLF